VTHGNSIYFSEKRTYKSLSGWSAARSIFFLRPILLQSTALSNAKDVFRNTFRFGGALSLLRGIFLPSGNGRARQSGQ
jgi:hypothetical protein